MPGQQLRIERRLRLLPACHDPCLPVHVANVRLSQTADVGEGHARECREDEQVAVEGLPWVAQRVAHQLQQLLLCEVFALAYVLADMEVAERIDGNLPLLTGTGHHPLEVLAGQPHRAASQAQRGAQEGGEVGNEAGLQFEQGDVGPMQLGGEVAGHMPPQLLATAKGACRTVDAYALLQLLQVVVVGRQQSGLLVSLVGCAHNN